MKIIWQIDPEDVAKLRAFVEAVVFDRDRICDNEMCQRGIAAQDSDGQSKSVGFWNPGNLENWTEAAVIRMLNASKKEFDP